MRLDVYYIADEFEQSAECVEIDEYDEELIIKILKDTHGFNNVYIISVVDEDGIEHC